MHEWKGLVYRSRVSYEGIRRGRHQRESRQQFRRGPRYGLRIKFKTNIKSLIVPGTVRPRPIEEAVEQLRKLGPVEDNKD